MFPVGFDTETYLITKSNTTPKPVCCTWFDGNRRWITRPGDPETYAVLARPDTVLIGHGVVYDLLVMMRWHPETVPLIIQMLDEGRVRDTDIRESLWYLQTKGGFGFPDQWSLADLVMKYCQVDISQGKEATDAWRLRFGTLDGVPFDQWPSEARDYAMDDAVWAYKVAQAQGIWQETLPTEETQIRGAVALGGTSSWGFMVNQDVLQDIRGILTTKIQECDEITGHLGWSGKGSEERLQRALRQAWNYKQAQQLQSVAQMQGWHIDWSQWPADEDIQVQVKEGNLHWFSGDVSSLQKVVLAKNFPRPPTTKKKLKSGHTNIKSDEPAVRLVQDCYLVTDANGQQHEAFRVFQDRKHYNKLKGTYCEALLGSEVVHAAYRTLVSTGRTGCREPNLQNWPARDDLPMRRMFRARPGMKLGTADWGAVELCTLAATVRTFWPHVRCHLGEVLDRGDDPHCLTASIFLQKPYEEVYAGRKGEFKDIRQGSKASNFGFPGGLGLGAFMAFAENNYGVKLTYKEAMNYHRGWCKAYPEIPGTFLAYVGQCVPRGQTGTAILINGRQKADCIFTQHANFHFQALAADGAKESHYGIWKECVLGGYYRRRPWLRGYGYELGEGYLAYSHPVNFVHDETVCEHPEDEAGKKALGRQEEIMIDQMGKTCNHKVPITVEGCLADEWAH